MKKKEKKKKILILSIIIVIILILIVLINIYNENREKKKYKDKIYTSIKDFQTAKEVVLYMGGDFIKQKQKEDITTIYLRFNKPLITEEGTNKNFFELMSIYMAYVQSYNDFILVDQEANIEIRVKCNKEKAEVTGIEINGKENFFNNEEAKQELDNIKEYPDTEFIVNSRIIKDLIRFDWNNKDINFGKRTKIEEDYHIYEEKGIKQRIIGSKIFNIVLNKKYKEKVVNDIFVGESLENIEKKLGKPTFEENGIIGYKNKDIYIFFEKEEISIYRNEKIEDKEKNDLIDIIRKVDKKESVNSIIDELTDIWPDYDEKYSMENGIMVKYSLKGVKVSYNIESKNGITFYNNYKGNVIENVDLKNINKDRLTNRVNINADEDMVFNKERERVLLQTEMIY